MFIICPGAGELAQQLRALGAFAQDPGSDLSAHAGSQPPVTVAPGDPVPSFIFCERLCTPALAPAHTQIVF